MKKKKKKERSAGINLREDTRRHGDAALQHFHSLLHFPSRLIRSSSDQLLKAIVYEAQGRRFKLLAHETDSFFSAIQQSDSSSKLRRKIKCLSNLLN